jgi:glycosyltransferase involved in cell wall biosynthesis
MVISGAVIVKDRIGTIEKCIESLLFCGELICVDTGSTDGTLEYLKHLQANNSKVKVYEYPFTDFSDVRNFGLSKCSGDWIFYLDSDEYLESKYRDEILRIVNEDNADAWELIQMSILTSGDYALVPSLRLFKAGIKFELGVHETVIFSAVKNKYRIGKINIPFQHTGYQDKKDFYPVPETHPLNLYYNNKGDVNNIENLIKEKPLTNQFKAHLYLMLAEEYHNQGYVYKALRLCNESINLIPEQNLGYMTLGLIYGRLGLVDLAKETISKINTDKIVCNIFNDKYYTKETVNETLRELNLAINFETEYLKQLKGI